jgi:N6-adenosine-specific RNA methylase IME4
MGRGLGGAYGICTEYLIFGRRGTLKAKERSFRNWFNVPRKGGHSVKPEFFYDLVEKVSPGDYLEIFARKPRLGWTSLGNEITGRDIVEDLAKLGKP